MERQSNTRKKCFNMELVYKTSAFITAFSIKGNFGSFLSAFLSPTSCLCTLLCNLFWSACPLCHTCPFALLSFLTLSWSLFSFSFLVLLTCTPIYVHTCMHYKLEFTDKSKHGFCFWITSFNMTVFYTH